MLSVKKKIQAAHSHDPSWQKLIFSGKILNDDAKVGEYNIGENDFLVLMVRKVIICIYSFVIVPVRDTPIIVFKTLFGRGN